ncbi:MAG: translation initiation factor 2 [bacterium]|nr:translation initiation factor 2 [bacterium]
MEAKLQSVRLSRRVLMNLLGSLERSRREEISRLRAANRRLRGENRRYAGALVERDRRIGHLEGMLEPGPGREETRGRVPSPA